MSTFASKHLGSRSAQDSELPQHTGQAPASRPMSVASFEEPPSTNHFRRHETLLLGPAGPDRPRMRRASSYGDVPTGVEDVSPETTDQANDHYAEDVSRPTDFRQRTPSVLDARRAGHYRTHQGRSSTYKRLSRVRESQGCQHDTYPSQSHGRQPSTVWARQSSFVQERLARMTWTQAEQMYSLSDNFANNDEEQREFFERTSIFGVEADQGRQVNAKSSDLEKGEVAVDEYPVIPDPQDPAKTLSRWNLRGQKFAFGLFVVSLNLGCLFAALFAGGYSGDFVFAFILYIHAKDFLSCVLSMIVLPCRAIWRYFRPLPPVDGKWILTLIPAYSESEEQIVNCILSLRDNEVAPHEQVMVVMLDGKPRDVKRHMRIIRSFRRPYVTSRWKRGELLIDLGFIHDVPVIVIEKVKNAGKKDSLILCHDLFNVLRDNAPLYTKLLRGEIWTKCLPLLTSNKSIPFEKFDMVFCTDADSIIHKGAIKNLGDALMRDPNAIATCGLVLVELQEGKKWNMWNLYQSFQYTFGQYVRRQAESIWGKVTCLPGCITMIAVRPEMAGAMRKYAEPITTTPVFHHQVQYLGTDRRLTYAMLSQDKKLHTIFVPSAVSETEAPLSFTHYLSQRRRWGSNAYFNNFFYLFGEKMIFISRLAASIEITRLSMVYYRIANTILFVYGLTKSFHILKLVPLMVVSFLPTIWFFTQVTFQAPLRERAMKLVLGFMINKLASPFMSLTIFSNVLRNLGSQVWGKTGGAAAQVKTAEPTTPAEETSTDKTRGSDGPPGSTMPSGIQVPQMAGIPPTDLTASLLMTGALPGPDSPSDGGSPTYQSGLPSPTSGISPVVSPRSSALHTVLPPRALISPSASEQSFGSSFEIQRPDPLSSTFSQPLPPAHPSFLHTMHLLEEDSTYDPDVAVLSPGPRRPAPPPPRKAGRRNHSAAS